MSSFLPRRSKSPIKIEIIKSTIPNTHSQVWVRCWHRLQGVRSRSSHILRLLYNGLNAWSDITTSSRCILISSVMSYRRFSMNGKYSLLMVSPQLADIIAGSFWKVDCIILSPASVLDLPTCFIDSSLHRRPPFKTIFRYLHPSQFWLSYKWL